jgi:HD-like signal output (HDOD) protein
MFKSLRRWLRRGSSDVAAAVPGTVPAAAAAPPSAPAPVLPPSLAAFEVGPPEDVGAFFTAQLGERITALRDGLAPADRTSDLPALLDRLLSGQALQVRQLPAAAQQALAVCDDPLAGLAQLVPLFLKDPTLTQALLRLANSAYYGGGEPVVGLREAVQRVGVGGVRSVILEATVKGMLCRPGGAFGVLASHTWEHMARTAPIARNLARPLGADPDQAFAMGLLHDVGKLVLFDAATALRGERKRDLQLADAVIPRLVHDLHEPLGGLAIHAWGLGPAAALAVGRHHRSPPPPWHDPLNEALHVAEQADYAAMKGQRLDLLGIWEEGGLLGDATAAAQALAPS